MLQMSAHTRMHILPNHHISESGDMRGFLFQANRDDYASVLPFSADMYSCTCLYECNYGKNPAKFDQKMLGMLNNIDEFQKQIAEVLTDIEKSQDQEAKLNCMPDIGNDFEDFIPSLQDSRAWKPSIPDYVGVHHAFVRNKVTSSREHRIYIVVTGKLPYACEELYNLWHDVKSKINTKEFVECAELYWLREAVVRSHNRVAFMLSQKLNLDVRITRDFDAPNSVNSAVPTTITRTHDIRFNTDLNVVEITNNGCFSDLSFNGILIDTRGLDGFWLVEGEYDSSDRMPYGIQLQHTPLNCFPTTSAYFSSNFRPSLSQSLRVHRNEMHEDVMSLDEVFMQTVSRMGFNRNNEVIALMQVAGVLRKRI